MKFVYSVSAAFLCVGVASAQFAVVPSAFSATAGGSTFLGPLSNAARTYQLLIHRDQLSGVIGQNITGMTWRLPTTVTTPWPVANLTYSSYDVRLSDSVDPANRSLTSISSNVVGAQTLVRSGALVIPTSSFAATGTPRDWGFEIAFSTPYLYTGTNLMIEIRQTGSDGASSSVDAVAATNTAAGYGTMFSAAWSSSATQTGAGSQGNFAVTRLTTTPVPEPASMLALGGGLAVLLRRRKAVRK